MRRETLSIAFAVALGAFVGALSALEIQSRLVLGSYLWIIGAPFGGLIAWCTVDFKQFCSGVARSYRVSASSFASAYHKLIRWQPNKLYWKALMARTLGNVAFLTSLGLLSFAELSFAESLKPGVFFISLYFFGWATVVITMLLAVDAIMFVPTELTFQGSNCGSRRSHDVYLINETKKGWFFLKFYNPIVLPVTLGKKLMPVIFVIISHFWENRLPIANAVIFAGKEIGHFFARIFVYAHSERRTICFVDATLGAIAGFFLGSAIAGAVVGAIFGVINYEVVSIRWLKLVPVKTE